MSARSTSPSSILIGTSQSMRMPSRTSLRCSWVLPPVARARVSSTEVIPVLHARSLPDVSAMQSFPFERYIMVGTVRSQFLRRGGSVKLFSFWRSLATFRVRIALNLKGLVPEEVIDVDLMQGRQRDAKYRAVNPQMLLPALVDGEGPALFQSLAIMEYLEETHPQPPLLPQGARARARVRGLAQIVACDSHPLLVTRVREYLEHELKLDEPTRLKWIHNWIGEAVKALEANLAGSDDTGRYCHGDAITIADICLASQAAGANFYKYDLAPFPTVRRIVDACMQNDAFARAHPLRQPGAPKAA